MSDIKATADPHRTEVTTVLVYVTVLMQGDRGKRGKNGSPGAQGPRGPPGLQVVKYSFPYGYLEALLSKAFFQQSSSKKPL